MLTIGPIHLAPAQAFVKEYHRHSIPPVGGKLLKSSNQSSRLNLSSREQFLIIYN